MVILYGESKYIYGKTFFILGKFKILMSVLEEYVLDLMTATKFEDEDFSKQYSML